MPCDRCPTLRTPVRNTNIIFFAKEQVCPNLHASSYGPFKFRILSGSSSVSGHTPSPPIRKSDRTQAGTKKVRPARSDRYAL